MHVHRIGENIWKLFLISKSLVVFLGWNDPPVHVSCNTDILMYLLMFDGPVNYLLLNFILLLSLLHVSGCDGFNWESSAYFWCNWRRTYPHGIRCVISRIIQKLHYDLLWYGRLTCSLQDLWLPTRDPRRISKAIPRLSIWGYFF